MKDKKHDDGGSGCNGEEQQTLNVHGQESLSTIELNSTSDFTPMISQ